jgi:eukaryotic-like serine/threonine-protein kinase
MNEEEVFHEALARRPEEQAAYLEQACAGDPGLRAAVGALLRANVGATGFLEQPALAPVGTVDGPVTERPGTVIGSYKLLEQIGEGGFGIVFMAEQLEPIRRKVALKVVKPGMDTRQVIARFEAERQALAIMDHPNIAKVHDGGATPSGRPYFVMELVKGVPITEFCDQNHLTPRQRLELFIPVCEAVHHAHQKSIIHRDLKPSNVLVAVHDTIPVSKIIDFGVAKALGQELTDKTLFTGFAQMIGTPLYMSPEQAGQSSLDVDTRSDIYSLGVLLYELLTGTTPFTKERFKQTAYDEIRRIIRDEDPPKPSTRLSELSRSGELRRSGEPSRTSGSTAPIAPPTSSLASVAAQRQTEPAKLTKLVRGELDWIVMKALEKNRNRRYETALDLAADIRRHLRDEPVLACPPTLRYRLGKLLRKHRGPVAAVATVWFVLVGGIAATTIAYGQARAAERQARQAEAEARATADFLTYDVLGPAHEGPAGGYSRDVTIREALDAAARTIDHALGQNPRVEAAVRHVMGATYRFLGEYEKARPHLQRAVALRTRELGTDDPATLTSEHHLCNVLHNQGDLAKAETLGRAVLDARRKRLPPGDVDIASSLALLGLILTDEGDPEGAEPLLREALDIFRNVLSESHWRTANVQSLLGGCLCAQKRYADAEPLLLAACQTLWTAQGAPRRHAQRALKNTVQLYEASGKKDKADEWRKKLQGLKTGNWPEAKPSHEKER